MESDDASGGDLCSDIYFPVPIFNNPTPGEPALYADQSTFAHRVIGSLLIIMVGIWAAAVLSGKMTEWTHRLYIATGLCQIVMGSFLISWLFVFLHPADLEALREYGMVLLNLPRSSSRGSLILLLVCVICSHERSDAAPTSRDCAVYAGSWSGGSESLMETCFGTFTIILITFHRFWPIWCLFQFS